MNRLIFLLLVCSKIICGDTQDHYTAIIGNQVNDDRRQGLYVSSHQSIISSHHYSLTEQDLCKAYLQHCYFLQNYFRTLSEIQKLFSYDFDYVVKTIINDERLSKKAALELWTAYENKRCFHKKEKADGREKIKQVFAKREAELQVRQQEFERLQNLYQEVSLPKEIVSERHKQMYTLRQKALDQTKQENYTKFTKRYDFDPQTAGMLHAKGITFDRLTGTSFQHCLYKEVATTYQQAAKVLYQYGIEQSIFVSHALSFSGISCESIDQELLSMAMAFNDVSSLLTSYSLAVCQGLFDSLQDNLEIIMHPAKTTESLKLLVNRLLDAMIDVSKVQHCNLINCVDAFTSCARRYVQIEELVGYGFEQLKSWFDTSSGQDKVRVGTRVLADICLPQKICSAIGSLCGAMASQARGVRTLEGVTGLAEDLGLLGEELKLIEAVADVEVADLSVQMMNYDAGKVVQVSAGVTSTVEDLVKTIRTYGLESKLLQQEVKAYFNHEFCKKELLEFCKDAQKLYTRTRVLYNGKQTEIICRIEHIMTYDLKFRANKQTGLMEGFISGGHVGTKSKQLEQAGHIMVKSEAMLPGGVRAVEYETKFSNAVMRKTEYPLSWSSEKIMQANLEAFANQRYMEEFKICGIPHEYIIGVSKDKVLIEMFVAINQDGSLKMTSAYPYYQKFSKVRKL